MTSRYFPSTPTSAGNILVPNSSPPTSDSPNRGHQGLFTNDNSDTIPGLVHSDNAWRSLTSSTVDLLSQSSGFTASSAPLDASSTRSLGSNGWTPSASSTEQSSREGEPPRKRLNRGQSPPDPRDLFNSPDSPEIQRPGQRRRLIHDGTITSMSSDESMSEATRDMAGSSKPRIIRGHRDEPPTQEHPSPEKPTKDPLLTRFIITQPGHDPWRVQCAWEQCNGDAKAATLLLDDASFQPTRPSAPKPVATVKPVQHRGDIGRVKEVDEATKAERQRVREMGKKSMIYAPHKLQPMTPPVSKVISNTTVASPISPISPEIVKPRTKLLKRKVVESDSEPDWSDDDSNHSQQHDDDDANELKALEYFNSAAAEELQELTGTFHCYSTSHKYQCYDQVALWTKPPRSWSSDLS